MGDYAFLRAEEIERLLENINAALDSLDEAWSCISGQKQRQLHII